MSILIYSFSDTYYVWAACDLNQGKIEFRFRERLIWEKGAKKIEVRFRERLIWENGAKKQVLQKKKQRVIQQQFIQFEKKGLSPGAKKTVRIKRVAVKRAWVSTKYTIVKENFLRFATTWAALYYYLYRNNAEKVDRVQESN